LIGKIVNILILEIVFVPIVSLFVLSIDTIFLEKNSHDIILLVTSTKLLNSLKLAFVVSFFSSFFAFCTAILFYHIKYSVIRYFFLLTLFFLFATAPIIYTSLLSEIALFNALSPLLRSVIILTLWLLPLASGIMILMMRYVDQSSLDTLKFLTLTKFVVFKEILFKQSYFSLLGIFFLIFIMAFIQEEVPSFFGYHTYAEDFLSRIVLMENFESTLFYALPFIILALVSSSLFFFLIKKSIWKLFSDLITPLEKLDLISSQKTVYFSVVVFVLVVFFIFFGLIHKVEYSMVMPLFRENSSLLLNSFLLSFGAAFGATVLSLHFVNCFKHSRQKMILLITFLSLYWFLPSSLTALILLKFSQLFYSSSEAYAYVLLLYGYILHVLPVALIMMMVMSRHNDSSYFLRLVKISRWHLFFTIVLPMEWRKWLMTLGILFFLVLNEITTTVLLVPPGFETIVVKIYNLMHYGDFKTVAFLSLLQSTLVLSVLSFVISVGGFHDKY
jgi:iron(III) transport system permease protein